MTINEDVTGIILAGGKAKRMNHMDKGLVLLEGKPFIEYVINTLLPQVHSIIISANRNVDQYSRYGHEVIKDTLTGYHGPLAGIASCLTDVKTKYIVIVPCDAPLLPNDLVHRLYQQIQIESADIAAVHDGVRLQPLFSLLKIELLQSLLEYLKTGNRKTDKWLAMQNTTLTDYSDKPEAFLNINTSDDIIKAINNSKSNND